MALFLTIFVYSLPLAKDNIFYRFSEYTYIGVSIGYLAAMAVKSIIDSAFTPITEGRYQYIVAIVLGFILYMRYNKKTYPISRWPLAIIIGVGTGLGLRGVIKPYIIDQVVATITPLWVGKPLASFNNIVILIIVVTCLSFFIFTYKRVGIISRTAEIGSYFLMALFGGIFANVCMTRLTLLAGRVKFIVETLLTLFT